MNTGKAAAAYADRLKLAVFPCARNNKVPAISGGHGCLDATRDLGTIGTWWTQYQDANIGLATGAINGIIAIDIDVKPDKGIHGDETFADLEKRLGKLPDTWEALTPHGGRHLLFKYPAGYNIGNGEGGRDRMQDYPGIDIRGNSGYILVEPSVVDGKPYLWESSSRPSETRLAELPTRWIVWLNEMAGSIDNIRFLLPSTIKEGTRNGTLYKFACSLRARGGEHDDILAALAKVNSDRCRPMMSDRELESIVKSALKFPAGAAPQQKQEQKTRLTIESLVMELDSRGYDVKYNAITGDIETPGRTAGGNPLTLDNLTRLLYSDLAGKYKGCSMDIIREFLAFIGSEHKYNPVLEWMQGLKWDGKSRLQEVYTLIGIERDALSKILVEKWLLQAVALLFNDASDPFGADGVLVLNGEQGAGKTSFFRHLAMRDAWFGEGSVVSDRDKDTTRRIVTKWISELGEVESTLKSDISALKAFTTSAVDRYRLPYGKSDVVAPRMTSLCATCNSDRYLIDPTGNRRWWSVPFGRIVPHDEIVKLDAGQLWAEIYSRVEPLDYKGKAYCFRLKSNERDALEARNGYFEKPVKAQPEVEDILARAERENLTTKEMTASEFKSLWDVLRPYTAAQIGAALAKCGVEQHKTKAARTYPLPTPYKT